VHLPASCVRTEGKIVGPRCLAIGLARDDGDDSPLHESVDKIAVEGLVANEERVALHLSSDSVRSRGQRMQEPFPKQKNIEGLGDHSTRSNSLPIVRPTSCVRSRAFKHPWRSGSIQRFQCRAQPRCRELDRKP
jgi:hypothetical protein